MPITPNDLVAVESSPEADELWALAYLLSADWGEEVTVATAFQTDITTQHIDSEQRLGLINRGTRIVEAAAASFNYDELLSLQSSLARMMKAGSLFPLVPDFSTLTANAGIGTTTINCNTTNKRFFQGGRIAIVNSSYTNFSVRKIVSLTANDITIDTALDVAFLAGAEVMPLIEAKLVLQASMVVKTDRTVICKLSAQELPGPHTLDPLQQPGTTPAGFTTYRGYPIFNLKINMREDAKFDLVRTGSFSGSGVSQVVSLYGTRPRGVRSGLLSFFDRASAFNWIKLFESRAGRLFPFWAVSQTSDFQFISFGSGTITVKAVGPTIDWNFRPWIAMVAKDGTVEVREVQGVARSAGQDTLTLDSDFTIVAGNIDRVCIAQLSRFRSDEMRERWKTDTVMESAFDCIEMPAERSVSISNIRDPSTSGIPDRFNILACVQSIKDGDADSAGGGYDCEDCQLLDCHGIPVETEYGPALCNVVYILYNGEYRSRSFFDGTDYAAGVPGALNLGEFCGCRREYESTGNHCSLCLSGSGTYVNYFTWWCFQFGEVQWDRIAYLDFCCCDDIEDLEHQGCPRAG